MLWSDHVQLSLVQFEGKRHSNFIVALLLRLYLVVEDELVVPIEKSVKLENDLLLPEFLVDQIELTIDYLKIHFYLLFTVDHDKSSQHKVLLVQHFPENLLKPITSFLFSCISKVTISCGLNSFSFSSQSVERSIWSISFRFYINFP